MSTIHRMLVTPMPAMVAMQIGWCGSVAAYLRMLDFGMTAEDHEHWGWRCNSGGMFRLQDTGRVLEGGY
jgi:hypothetical protein